MAEEPPTASGCDENAASDVDDATGRRMNPLGGVGRTMAAALRVLRGASISFDPYDPAVHQPLVGDDEPPFETVERYWVDAPFSYVTIGHDHQRNEHRYVPVEPSLTADERRYLDVLFEDVREPLLHRDRDDADLETLLRTTVHEYLERYGADLDTESVYRLYYYLHRDFLGYGRLDPIMHDPHVEDVSCDGYDVPIFVYHEAYTDVETTVSFGPDELDRFVVRLAQQSGRHISIDDPLVESTLPDGSRAELALGEDVTPRGSAFTIRKYAEEPFTPIDLLEYGTVSVEQLAYLWLAIEHNRSLLFAGGTASGKTTSMNALSMFIPPRSKIVSIEDTRELTLNHGNWLAAVTRERIHEGRDITMYDLLRSALRHRPEFIIVGEVRGEEAITLFQAMNTGHTTYSTMHADSVETVINRLENEPINVPRAMVQSLDILSVQTLTRFDGDRVRRTKLLAEIEGIDQRTGELDYSMAYEWDGRTDTFTGESSHVLEEIADENGWSTRDLREEYRNRVQFLEYLHENGITDYRRFSALVNEYYSDSEAVLDAMGRSAGDRSAGTAGSTAAEIPADETADEHTESADEADADDAEPAGDTEPTDDTDPAGDTEPTDDTDPTDGTESRDERASDPFRSAEDGVREDREAEIPAQGTDTGPETRGTESSDGADQSADSDDSVLDR